MNGKPQFSFIMEKSADTSRLPRSSGISRLPKFPISRIPSKPSSSQLPEKYGLSVPRSRLREKPTTSFTQTAQGHTGVGDNPNVPISKNEDRGSSSNVELKESSRDILGNMPDPDPIRQDDKKEENEAGAAGSVDLDSQSSTKSTYAMPHRPRMSLSDRTIETLSQIPPSPSPRRRKSNFYPAERPPSSLSRPASSLSQSRPGTSNGLRPSDFSTPRRPSPTKRPIDTMNGSYSVKQTPNRRSISSFVPRSLTRSQMISHDKAETIPTKLPPVPQLSGNLVAKWPNSQPTKNGYANGSDTTSKMATSHVKSSQSFRNGAGNDQAVKSQFKSKTYAPKSSRQRPPVSNLFPQTPPNANKEKKNIVSVLPQKLATNVTIKSRQPSSMISAVVMPSRTVSASDGPSSLASGTSSLKESPKSSAALRETIAKAKAARRTAMKEQGSQSVAECRVISPNKTVDSNGLFGQADQAQNVLRKRINEARTSGRLNISAMGLAEFPKEINEMYNFERIESDQGAWYESVDLVRVIAADNELEVLEDWIFPDISIEEAKDLDDFCGNTFRGLESLDLHGNRLTMLPVGLRRLERLTTLNLSRNRLTNECLDLLGQIHSLRELRLGKNHLNGELVGLLSACRSLEVLDLHDNAISKISNDLADLLRLRVLIVAGNGLTSLPFQSLQKLPLVELDAARNRLAGTLIPKDIDALPNLKSLNVSSNALTNLQISTVALPSLQVLNVGENRLGALPILTEWKNLITISAGGNQITSIPEGLTSLESLRNLDLARNSLKALDNNIGLMDSLTNLHIANNPLRERRHLTLPIDDLKTELRDRLLPPPEPLSVTSYEQNDNPLCQPLSQDSKPLSKWPVTQSGILDRSGTSLQTLNNIDLEPVLHPTPIRSLILHHNILTHIPPAISLLGATLTSLDLAHNRLSSTTPSNLHPITLPHLTSLSLASNALSSLQPLKSLTAPLLQTLNIAHNRIPSLPALRPQYPCLTIILASENTITNLEIESVRGLAVLDVTGNEITSLRAELGLLEAKGLRDFRVGGNRFRVPRREVVERGSAAVLAWLRGRIVEGNGE